MSLHRRHSAGKKALDVTQASGDLSLSVPKYKIPPAERSARTAYALVHDELLLDGNSRQNLATFCTTWIEPEARALLEECIERTCATRTSIRRPRRLRTAACTSWRTCGIRRTAPTR